MKRLMLISAFIIYSSVALFAQAPDILWSKTFGGSSSDEGYSVQQTSDGGYIIIGFTNSFGSEDRNIWLIKTDANGDTLWTKTFGGNNGALGHSVQQTTDGGYIVTGYTDAFGAQDRDVWLIKTDARGDTLWTKTYGGESGYNDEGRHVQQTTDGGYIITGNTRAFILSSDAWLLKTDASGDTLWTRTFGVADYYEGYSVQQTIDGGYILNIRQSLGTKDFYLIKTDESGETLWTKAYGGSGSDKSHFAQQTIDNGYIITGKTGSFGAGGSDVWLVKTDVNGDTLWTRTFGGINGDEGNSIQQTTDSGFIITGITNQFSINSGDLWLIKTDVSGDTLWTIRLGGSERDEGRSVQQTADGGYIITGYTESFGAGDSDVWLIKTAPEITGIIRPERQPSSFTLHQNYPNPFNPTTNIQYAIDSRQFVTLKVFDLLGQETATLVNEEKPSGSYTVAFDASGLSSGLYFYQLQAAGFTETKKMILMR